MENFKTYSNPLFDDEEIISNKIHPLYFNAESNLIKSLPNRDTLFDSSPKFDYLEEFSIELMPTSIINEEQSVKRLNNRLESLRKTLEDNGLRVSREKTTYLDVILVGGGIKNAEVDLRVKAMVVKGSRRKGRPKLKWEDRLKMDMKELCLSEDMTSDRNA
nr:hypothetical protein [Tanacetum cinerariifolium]